MNELLRKIKHSRIEYPLLHEVFNEINNNITNDDSFIIYRIDDINIFKLLGNTVYFNQSLIQLFFKNTNIKNSSEILLDIIYNTTHVNITDIHYILDDDLTDIYYLIKDKYNLTIEYVFG